MIFEINSVGLFSTTFAFICMVPRVVGPVCEQIVHVLVLLNFDSLASE